MESLSNPFVLIAFLLTLIVISLSVISIRIQRSNKIQKRSIDESKIKSDGEYSAIGVYFQGDKTLAKCPNCAELVNIEAKICKSCASNVENHTSEVHKKLLALEAAHEKVRVENQIQRVQNFRKSLKLVIIAVTTLAALVPVYSFVSDHFFPTKTQQLATSVEVAIAKCGFKNIKVVLHNKSDSAFPDYPYAFEASAKFKESPAKVECVKKSLDAIYFDFNQATPNNGHTAGYFIGNSNSGSWNNDYAGANETYTLEHQWYDYE
jgi:hypothetical protein